MVEVRKDVKVPLYGGWIFIVITDEKTPYEAAKRHFKVDNKEIIKNDAVVLASTDNDMVYPIIFSRNLTPGIIAHEAKHVVNKIYNDIGIFLDVKNDEPETYLLSWIVNRIYEAKSEYEKKKKKHEKSN